MKKITVIIPFKNEGEEVEKTIVSLENHSDTSLYDVLLVNDASDDGFDYQSIAVRHDNVNYICNPASLGVAGSRDEGVSVSSTPYVLLLDGHMRFFDDVITPLVERLEETADTLFCLQSRILKRFDDGYIYKNELLPACRGAYINFEDIHPPKIGQACWDSLDAIDYTLDVVDIPCVMGAAYAISREYYLRLHGLNGLALYGQDEAFLSTKVWLSGGRCQLLRTLEAGHIYRSKAPYINDGLCISYNRLLYTYLLIPDLFLELSDKLRQMMHPRQYEIVMNEFYSNESAIEQEREYLSGIFVRTQTDIINLNKKDHGIRIYP